MINSIKFFTKAVIFTFVLWRCTECTVQAQTKQLWGMTGRGGENVGGTIFTIDSLGNNHNVEQSFLFQDKGASPYGSLIQASDGKLYGLTSAGGTNGIGVLFQYDPANSTFTKKIDFADTTSGHSPLGSLIQASDGKFYGLTVNGGTFGQGVLFQYDPITSSLTKKYDFALGANGCNPYSSLLQANDGKLYGVTGSGGTNGTGVLFQYDPATSNYIKKYDFASATGDAPFGSLIQASDGKLYGITNSGGTNYLGVLYQYDPITSIYTKKFDFDMTNGARPYGALKQATDGKFYGMTAQGGANNLGVLFQYDPANSTYTKKLDFNGSINGSSPYGSLMQASSGKLYGMTIRGGGYNMGVLFQYDPITSTYTKKLDFDDVNGSKPFYTELIEITVNNVGIFSFEQELAVKLYPNPVHDLLILELLKQNQKNATIIIENLFGQIIYETQINTATHQIHTENYASGIYLIKVKTNEGTSTRKIIVQ